MEGARQAKGHNGDGADHPKQNSDARGGFEWNAIDPGKCNNGSNLNPAAEPWNLNQAAQCPECEKHQDIHRSEPPRGLKAAQERKTAGYNDGPFEQGVTQQ